jgi:hypothetical protein
MTPPSWHQTVLELARSRFSEIPSSRHSMVRLLFIKYGQIHCRTFFSDNRDADEPGRVDLPNVTNRRFLSADMRPRLWRWE